MAVTFCPQFSFTGGQLDANISQRGDLQQYYRGLKKAENVMIKLTGGAKRRYGTKLLKLGLEKAKELIKEEKILITCDDDNIGSYKIIEKNGGILENKVLNTEDEETFLTRRYWIEIR